MTAGTSAVAAVKKATKTTRSSLPQLEILRALDWSAASRIPGGMSQACRTGKPILPARDLGCCDRLFPACTSLGNRASADVRLEMDALQKMARKLKLDPVTCDIRREPQIAAAIKAMKGNVDALYVCADPFVTHHQIGINTMAAGARLPAMQAFRHQSRRAA